jgi:thiol-disulfide isomerase/thioredoxin
MNKSPINQKLKWIVTTLKPWVVAFVFVLILRYTGALSGLSFLAQSAAMETGAMDIEIPEAAAKPTPFNYDFKLKDMDGNVVDVESLRGKVIFLNLWATWCGPCRAEMPSIQEIYNEKKDNVVFVMLSLDNENQQHKIKKYIADKDFTFPVYVPSGPLPEQLHVPSIPTTFVISKDGFIKTKKIGAANYDTDKFRKMLDELIANGESQPN